MKTLGRALRLLVVMAVLTGVIYPLAVTGLAGLAFPWQAGGSLVERRGQTVGSALIGQCFDGAPAFFQGRPSTTRPHPCDAGASGGSNLGPTNPEWIAAVRDRAERLRATNPDAPGPVPQDLATASASGLDPDISPAAAMWQVARVARARGLPQARVRSLVEAHVVPRQWGVLGEPRVNVLRLNLALEEVVP